MKQTNRRGNKQSQESVRLQVVEFLSKKNNTQQEAAFKFGISKSAVYKIWFRYKNSGKDLESLQARLRGSKDGKKLKAKQTSKIKRLINRKPPRSSKLAPVIWTVANVKALIHRECQVNLSRSQVSRLLKNWEYDSQKPIQLLLETKSEDEKRWFNEYYQAIKKVAKKYNAEIYFGDETGRQNEHLKDAEYVPQKVDMVDYDADRKDFNVNKISAINSKGHLQFSVIYGEINSNVIQTFLETLQIHSKKKIIYITDSFYKTKKLDHWSKTHEKINICFLPTDFQKHINNANKDQDLIKHIKAAFQTPIKRRKGKKSFVRQEDYVDLMNEFKDYGSHYT